MIAVISTPNSRRTAIPTSSTVNTLKPSWPSRLAPMKATTAPMKKDRTATMGRAFTPTSSIAHTVGVRRNRQGWAAVEMAVVTVRPKKAKVATASR